MSSTSSFSLALAAEFSPFAKPTTEATNHFSQLSRKLWTSPFWCWGSCMAPANAGRLQAWISCLISIPNDPLVSTSSWISEVYQLWLKHNATRNAGMIRIPRRDQNRIYIIFVYVHACNMYVLYVCVYIYIFMIPHLSGHFSLHCQTNLSCFK